MTSIHRSERKNEIIKPKSNNPFALIDNYENLVKNMGCDVTDCNDVMMGLDQEVPVGPLCPSAMTSYGQPHLDHLDNRLQDSSASTAYSKTPSFIPANNTVGNASYNNNNNNNNGSNNNIPFSLFKEEEMTPPSSSSPVGYIQGQCPSQTTCHSFGPSYSSYSSNSLPQPIRKQQFSPTPSAPSTSSLSISSSSSPPAYWLSKSSLSSTPSLSSPSLSSLSSTPAFHKMDMTPISSPSQLLSSATSSSSSSSLFSYSSTSSPLLSSSPSSTWSPQNTYKQKTFLTELGGSGCTVLSTIPNFLSGDCQEMAPSRNQEESLEYTDLDKIPDMMSFYDDLTSGNNPKGAFMQDLKPVSTSDPDEVVPFEMMVSWMRESIEKDRRDLKLPQDPHSWTCPDVDVWVKWVCQKNNLPDISSHVSQFNGATLCTWSSALFTSQFGPSGCDVFQELDLWKTANSYNSMPPPSADGEHDCSSNSLTLSFLESTQVFLTPSTSPAPSHGSSQDSHHLFPMAAMETCSEDDVFYSSEVDVKPDITNCISKPATTATATATANNSNNNSNDSKVLPGIQRHPFRATTGRGHKKAITLWQFLLQLLVGQEDNSDCIRWLNKESRIFKIEDSKKVATLWGKVKSRPAMNYDKLSRSVRQYYKKGIIKKPEQTKRLVYQFCSGIC